MSNYEQFVRISSQLCATNMYFELSIFFILLEILNTNLPNPGSAPECTGHLFTPLVELIITWRHGLGGHGRFRNSRQHTQLVDPNYSHS